MAKSFGVRVGSFLAAGILCGVFGGGSLLPAQETSTGHLVVTVNTKSKAVEAETPLTPQAVTLYVNRKKQEVASLVPLRGDRAALQLVILLDDSSRMSLSLQLDDLRKFITALPPTTQVAVAYMRNGTAILAQNFTTNKAEAAKAFRLPIGYAGINGTPYFCLQDLIRRWPPNNSQLRREVIMITDGVDRYNGARFDPEDPYVQAAIRDAQKAGVLVYSIYYRGSGFYDNRTIGVNAGQNYLTMVSQETGGEAYFEGFGNPVSFQPFLSDIQHKLLNQYELSFVTAPRKEPLQVKLKTTQPNTKLAWPAQVIVTGTPVQ